MTERSAEKKPARLTKGSARAWGWVAGAVAFLLPWAAVGMKPKPTETAEGPAKQPRPVVIIRKITRRVVIQEQAPAASAPQVRYVDVGGSSGGSSGGGSAPAPPPPPPPASTGGS